MTAPETANAYQTVTSCPGDWGSAEQHPVAGFRPTRNGGAGMRMRRLHRHEAGGWTVSATAGPSESRRSAAGKLGLTTGQVVQELGWDEDVDDELRIGVEDAIDGELVEEAMDAVDVVLLWWRDDDGDLVDGLVDGVVDLSASGVLWLLTPKVGRSGYVDNADISEAAVTAGLSLTNSANVSPGLGRAQAASGRAVRGR